MFTNKNKRILIVATHPDDEVLGCGGTVARLIGEGSAAFTLILGEGITSRDEKRNRAKRVAELKKLKRCAYEANNILGIKKVLMYNFSDNRFDTVALLDIVKVIEKVKNEIKPNIIFTHHGLDLNIDHRITYEAVLTASRPTKEETVKEIYSFEVPSSTEWNYPYMFNPNVFVDITGTIDRKLAALKSYRSELRKFPYPRSEESIKVIARRWGCVAGFNYAEAFELIRSRG